MQIIADKKHTSRSQWLTPDRLASRCQILDALSAGWKFLDDRIRFASRSFHSQKRCAVAVRLITRLEILSERVGTAHRRALDISCFRSFRTAGGMRNYPRRQSEALRVP
jgi:hypothetical protein